MRKNMYNQPITEVIDLKTASLMQGMSVSPGTPTDPASPPTPGAPGRGEIIP
jgi:hypothetical protein